VKVYAPGTDLATLDGEAPYNVMFGPDICGASKKMVHVILGKKGDNHLITKKIACESDVFSHAYTLIIKPDNTYSVLIDNKEKESGTLGDDWEILEPKQIKDPNESKPEDWVDSPKMDDPEDVKPDDWDDVPAMIPDEEAEKPEDWDDDMDGEYEVPMVPNPDFRGEWRPKRIDNPDYKGAWEHPLIDNPDFEDDPTLYHFNSGAVGIDVWQVKSGSIFDDILVTDDVDYAKEVAEKAIEAAEVEAADKKVADDEKAAKQAEERKAQEEDFEEEDEDLLDDHDEL
jgi:calreticulin